MYQLHTQGNESYIYIQYVHSICDVLRLLCDHDNNDTNDNKISYHLVAQSSQPKLTSPDWEPPPRSPEFQWPRRNHLVQPIAALTAGGSLIEPLVFWNLWLTSSRIGVSLLLLLNHSEETRCLTTIICLEQTSQVVISRLQNNQLQLRYLPPRHWGLPSGHPRSPLHLSGIH